MTNRNTETPQGEGNAAPPPPPPGGPDPPESQASRGGNTIFKSGPLFISSKGIGWTSWKKRWFILTRTSLVFFRSDPSAVQKGSEVNLTLGGIDLNNSGSVVVKADKKLLTVLFPDGRDGRAFTLKAETLEDLHEWKTALENALSQAPNGGAHAVGQNGILGNEKTDPVDGSADQSKDKKPVKSTVIGVPVLLALEDVDGAPSFLEKALRFVEDHGVKVEGILRQAADVEDVESRVREYEQGKLEFTPEEDAHVIADCVKYVLRELPSPPVPASCCNALLDSFRKSGNDRNGRINAMRTTICDTFPEPNRRLLQRILLMMQSVAENKAVNRMSCSAVAACMAPLLLRPLLAGDCEIDNDFDVGGDGSVQLLQAAAAANHAQAIVITLLEEYDNIFGEGDMSPELYSDTEDDESETEGATDEDDDYYEDDETDVETDGEVDIVSDGTCSESGGSGHNDLHNNKDVDGVRSGSHSPHGDDDSKAQKLSSSSVKIMHPEEEHDVKSSVTEKDPNSSKTILAEPANEVVLVEDISTETSSTHQPTGHGLPTVQKSSTIANGPAENARHHRTAWGRTAARKNLSMESIDFGLEEEAEIEKLEITKSDLENRIAEEVQGNAVLQASLERQKTALRERRLALEQDVARLQEQLQKEKDLTAALEAGLNMSSGGVPNLANVDEKTRVDIEEIAQGEASVANLTKKVDDLGVQINQQRERNQGAMPDASTLSQCGHDQHEKSQTMNTSEAKQKDSEHEAIDLPEGEDYCLLDHRGGSDRSRSKDTNQDGSEDANEKKQDAAQKSNSRSVGAPAEVSAVQPVSSKPAPTNSKKSRSGGSSPDVSPVEPVGSKPNSTRSNKSGSGGGSSPEVSPVEPVGSKPSSSNSKKSGSGSETTSAITKLTSRLNFLKERRSQIANEISGRSSSGQPLPAQNLDKGQPLQNSDKNWENSEKPEKLRKAESHTERVKKSESQLQQQLDRGKSESHLSVTVEKGRVVESSKRSPGSR